MIDAHRWKGNEIKMKKMGPNMYGARESEGGGGKDINEGNILGKMVDGQNGGGD